LNCAGLACSPTILPRVAASAFFHHKDLGFALETARRFGVPLPITAQVDQMFASLEAKGHGDLDHSALLLYLEELASHHVGQS
jgi:2-hydroxy-3-oxopropionate reductase